jgi:trans-aconitate methyltransferase
MGHIFISYSRRDQEIVDRIVEAIKQAGLSVWLDREEAKATELWRRQIVEAVDSSDAFVLLLSPNSVTSKNVVREVDLAGGAGKQVVPMLLAPVKLPANLRYRLAGLQFIDLQNLGFDKAVNQLIGILKEQSKAAKEQPLRQTELVISAAFSPEKQKQLLDFISELTETRPSQLQISNLTPGLVFVGMPAGAAFELKTLALNLDDRLKQFGIKALRLLGDKNYVNISAETDSSIMPGRRPPGDPTTDAPPPKPKPK